MHPPKNSDPSHRLPSPSTVAIATGVALLFSCVAVEPATQSARPTWLIMENNLFYEVDLDVRSPISMEFDKARDLRFWQVTSKSWVSDGIGGGEDVAFLKTFKKEELEADVEKIKKRGEDVGDCGVEERWLKNGKWVARLKTFHKGNINPKVAKAIMAVGIPAGFSRETGPEVEKKLKELVRIELSANYGSEAAQTESLISSNLKLSGKFRNQDQIIWYISSEDDLRQYLSLYFQEAPNQ